MRWVCCTLIFCCQAVWASSVGPWLGVYTHHLSRDEPVNENNGLVGLRYDRWYLARFQNSFNEPSWVAGFTLWERNRPFLPEHTPNLSYSLRLSPGIAYGYGERLALTVHGFTPGLIPSAGLEWSFSERWFLGSDLLYIWTDDGGVLMQGVHLGWRW